jgi:hypothetical protein
MTRLALLAVLALPITASAQTHPLVGKWDLKLPPTKVLQNGVPVDVTPTGMLTFTIEGDSMIGVLKIVNGGGVADRPPVRLAAKVTPGRVTFYDRREAKLMAAGDERTATAVTTYEFEATVDALKGSASVAIEGMNAQPQGGAKVFTGTRAK